MENQLSSVQEYEKKIKSLSNPLYLRFWNRVHHYKKNCLIIICGETGSGKSTLGLKICKTLDPSFDVDRVISRPKQFLDVVVNGHLRMGQAIMIDEAGTVANAREWYSFNNKVISYILQTFTYRRLVVVFTVPSFDYVDRQSRMLFHYYVECKRINFATKETIAKVQRLQYNAMTGKLYRKYLRFVIGQDYCKVINYYFKRPPRELMKAYEKKSHQFKREIAIEMLDTIRKIEVKMSSATLDLYKKAIDIVELYDEDIIKERAGRLFANVSMIQTKYGLTPSEAKNLKALIDTILEKGFWEDESGKIRKLEKKSEPETPEPPKQPPTIKFNVCGVCGMTITKGYEGLASIGKCPDGHKWIY